MKRTKPEDEQALVPVMTYASHPKLMRMMHGGWKISVCYDEAARMYMAEAINPSRSGGMGSSGGSPLDAMERLEKLVSIEDLVTLHS